MNGVLNMALAVAGEGVWATHVAAEPVRRMFQKCRNAMAIFSTRILAHPAHALP